jgi:hypothetical protein
MMKLILLFLILFRQQIDAYLFNKFKDSQLLFSYKIGFSNFNKISCLSSREKKEINNQLNMSPNNNNPDVEISVDASPNFANKWIPSLENNNIPSPLNSIVDVNLERRAVVFELIIGRELGFEIIQGNDCAMVGQVLFF